MAVVPAAIAVFPVVINPDGTVNSSLNPAPPNGIVSVWGTGAGATGLPDGTLYPTPQSIPQPVSVINPNSVYVQYAGGAHGLVSGAFQVNFQVPFAPLTTTPYSFALEVPGGTFGSVSPNFVVSVKGAP